jgi:hypothetical protein
MSKLAHSNQETMDQIERQAREAEDRGELRDMRMPGAAYQPASGLGDLAEQDDPPSKCTGECCRNGKMMPPAAHWNENGFCNFCGEDGNA